MVRSSDEPILLGWREWVALPELGLLALRCKVDTGAATSALHAPEVEIIRRGGRAWARFHVRPFHRKQPGVAVACEAPVVDVREVTASSGHAETRVVVETALRVGLRAGSPAWPVELTLADRSALRYPMLLGRQAMEGRIHVDPGASFLLGEPAHPEDFYG
jgi:hypothetical protein